MYWYWVNNIQYKDRCIAPKSERVWGGLRNYLDAATQTSESCGGGGSSAMESDWGRKEDEDDIAWARHCAQQAFGMHKRRSRGIHF